MFRELSFSNRNIAARIEDGGRFGIEGMGILVNLSPELLRIEHPDMAALAPWSSALLKDVSVVAPGYAAVLQVISPRDMAGPCTSAWTRLSDKLDTFPVETPLFLSPQDRIGQVELDADAVRFLSLGANAAGVYDLLLNLWYAPEDTDCGIHREHGFYELHTQIHGRGAMEIFSEPDEATLIREIAMPVGATHSPIFVSDGAGAYRYPWHRYRSISDCIWMAIELHPASV